MHMERLPDKSTPRQPKVSFERIVADEKTAGRLEQRAEYLDELFTEPIDPAEYKSLWQPLQNELAHLPYRERKDMNELVSQLQTDTSVDQLLQHAVATDDEDGVLKRLARLSHMVDRSQRGPKGEDAKLDTLTTLQRDYVRFGDMLRYTALAGRYATTPEQTDPAQAERLRQLGDDIRQAGHDLLESDDMPETFKRRFDAETITVHVDPRDEGSSEIVESKVVEPEGGNNAAEKYPALEHQTEAKPSSEATTLIASDSATLEGTGPTPATGETIELGGPSHSPEAIAEAKAKEEAEAELKARTEGIVPAIEDKSFRSIPDSYIEKISAAGHQQAEHSVKPWEFHDSYEDYLYWEGLRSIDEESATATSRVTGEEVPLVPKGVWRTTENETSDDEFLLTPLDESPEEDGLTIDLESNDRLLNADEDDDSFVVDPDRHLRVDQDADHPPIEGWQPGRAPRQRNRRRPGPLKRLWRRIFGSPADSAA